jgi:dipeptidase E
VSKGTVVARHGRDTIPVDPTPVEEPVMKLLLTSGGITNPSIEAAMLDLLGKPVAESRALCIPTAQWGHRMLGPESVRSFITGGPGRGMTTMGWASVGVLELSALPTVGRERWEPWVREADILLVDGGDATYLCHWMRESGLADLVPVLDTVWAGLSAGSMVMTPRIGDDFVSWPGAPDDRTLGIVDFSIFPHVGHEMMPDNTMAAAEEWAAGIGGPAYAVDDQTALVVVDDAVEVVSEGTWRRLA